MMSDVSIMPWRICQACGHWQRVSEGVVCSMCQWSRLELGSPSVDLSEIRMLIDTELRSDNSWHVTGITTPRVGAAINQAIVLQRLNDDGLRALLRGLRTHAASLSSWRSWEEFREIASSLLTDEVNSLIGRSWQSLRQPSRARALVSIRVMLFNPDIKLGDGFSPPPWLEVIQFDKATTLAAAKLRDEDIKFHFSRTQVNFFAPERYQIEVAIQAPQEIFIEGCKVISDEKPLYTSPLARIVRRDTLTSLPSIYLSAEAVHSFAVKSTSSLDLLLSVRGTEKRFVTRIPIVTLPPFSAIADLFLDLGSTNTKWALRIDGNEPIELDQDTVTLTEEWKIDAYRKSDIISDTTGERWSDWVARALPALRCWVGSEHKAYLRNVHLSLPSTRQFDVISLARRVLSDAPSSNSHFFTSQRALRSAITHNLLAQGTVVLVPEHELVATHYLDVLRVLQRAAQAYARQFKSHNERIEDAKKRQQEWDTQQTKVKEYESRWFLSRLFNARPTGPNGSRPTVDEQIQNPADWMNKLIEHPEQFDHVILLDAGGLSLDVSVLERHELVRALSHSDISCGGEAISLQIGRREPGPRGTRYKAQLGPRWESNKDLSDPAQREYRDVTRELYGPVLTQVIRELGETRWKKSPYCCVLLTGGGSRNPHFKEYINELAIDVGLIATVVDAPLVQDLVRQAREFSNPLQELDSDAVRRFEATQRWSERRERQSFARYDKFAVVGGMLASKGDAR